MIVVLALVFAITLVLVFLCLAPGYLQQPPEDGRMSRPDPPWLVGDTPKYVPPQEVAEQYDSYVRQLNEEGRAAQAHSLVGLAGISKDATGGSRTSLRKGSQQNQHDHQALLVRKKSSD